MNIRGIIWDYDGTLVDTRIKNLNVTKAIMSDLTRRVNFSALDSIKNYDKANIASPNWRELYRKEFGLNEEQIDAAGRLWTKYQLADRTEVDLLDGISDTVTALQKYSQGIVSQNSSENIRNNLKRFHLDNYFGTIVGYEEVGLTKQKPDPEGLLKCVSELTGGNDEGSILYIGDHRTDMECAYNANEAMGRKRVISILLDTANRIDLNGWERKPDHRVDHPGVIIDIIDNLRIVKPQVLGRRNI